MISNLDQIIFKHPSFFYLLLLIPLMMAWYWWRASGSYPTFSMPTLQPFKKGPSGWRSSLRHLLFALRLIAFTLLVTALARPQTRSSQEEQHTKGIDIVLSTDISSSMLAEDFQPNRLEASKKVALQFIEDRPNDRIGLVTFAAESFTQCPLTSDHQVVRDLLKEVKSGMLKDGTAIGMGLATAVNRLKESKAESKVIILLTDGVNNAGIIDPQTAANIAEKFGITVYTVGVGSRGKAPFPVKTPLGKQYRKTEVRIDEALLQNIAKETGGKYFRATDKNKLKQIYNEIDQMEKTKLEVIQYSRHTEKFRAFALLGALLFVSELALRYTLLRNIP